MKKFLLSARRGRMAAVGAAFLAASLSAPALAASALSERISGWGGEMGAVADFAGWTFTLIGIIFLGLGVMKLREHFSNQQAAAQGALTGGIVGILTAGALIGLPAMMGTGVATLWGDTNDTITIGDTELRGIR